MKDRVDQALKLSREIMKLEQRERHIREKREQKRQELAHLLAGGALPPPDRPDYRPGTLTSKIITLLESKYPQTLTTDAIATTLETATPIVRSTLSRLKSQHHVDSPSRGEYRAVVHDEHQEGGAQN
jgi:hypothetical protein